MAHSIYSTLNHHDSIRVFKLHAGSFQSELQGDLQEVRLRDRPSYEAMSYVWGDTISSESLFITSNQTKIHITPSLALALRHFRSETNSRILWVDALCINQNENNPEKGHQVGLMDKIYKSAEKVLIWLGGANNNTAVIFEYIRVMAAVATRFIGYDIEECWTAEFPLVTRLKELDLEELGALVKLGWRVGVAELLSNPWFERLWVVQELCLAQSAIVYCGRHSVPWKHLGETVHLLREASYRWPVSKASANLIHITESLVRVRCEFLSRQRDQDIPLKPFRMSIRIFDLMRNRKCKNDRDRVYALMTLVEPEETLSIKSDYRLSVNQTYKMFARATLQRQGIIILTYAGLCHRSRYMQLPFTDKDYLPSWAPDFRKAQTTETKLPMHRGAISTVIKDLKISEVQLTPNENIVEFLGFLLDDIMICEAVPRYRGFAGIKEMRSIILKFEQIYHKFSRKGLFNKIMNDKDYTFAMTLVEVSDTYDAKKGWQAYRRQIIDNYMAWSHTEISTEGDTKTKLLCPGYESEMKLALEFHVRMCETIGGLKLFLTRDGFFGLGPSLVQQWDILAPISTDSRPYIVRKTSLAISPTGNTVFQLIGECHVCPFSFLPGLVVLGHQFPWVWISLI